jgi:hypothetical protein
VGENSRKLRRRRREKQDTNEWNGLFFCTIFTENENKSRERKTKRINKKNQNRL